LTVTVCVIAWLPEIAVREIGPHEP
jgi:hypothetical protein